MRPKLRNMPNFSRSMRSYLGVAALLIIGATFPVSASAKTPRDFFGIFAESPSKGEFKDMGKAGFGSYRVPVNWAAIQKTKNGDYDFSQSDYGVYYAAKHHMRPVPVVYGTPRFVHKPSSKGLYGADEQVGPEGVEAVLRGACRSATARRATTSTSSRRSTACPVKTWIVWNEQNSKNNWLPKADPRRVREGRREGRPGHQQGRSEGGDRARGHVRIPARTRSR